MANVVTPPELLFTRAFQFHPREARSELKRQAERARKAGERARRHAVSLAAAALEGAALQARHRRQDLQGRMTRAALLVALLRGARRRTRRTTGVAAERFSPAVGPTRARRRRRRGGDAAGRASRGRRRSTSLRRSDQACARRSPAASCRGRCDYQLVGDVSLEFGVWKRLALAVGVPVVLYQDGDRLQGTGVDERPLRRRWRATFAFAPRPRSSRARAGRGHLAAGDGARRRRVRFRRDLRRHRRAAARRRRAPRARDAGGIGGRALREGAHAVHDAIRRRAHLVGRRPRVSAFAAPVDHRRGARAASGRRRGRGPWSCAARCAASSARWRSMSAPAPASTATSARRPVACSSSPVACGPRRCYVDRMSERTEARDFRAPEASAARRPGAPSRSERAEQQWS